MIIIAAEKQFENKVKDWLESKGIYDAGTPQNKKTVPEIGWFMKVWGGGMQKSGIPDLLLCVNGFFISCELKAPNGRPSELQKKNTAAINQSNGIGVILKPDGFEQFKKIVEGVIQCRCHIQELNALKDVHSNTKCDIVTEYGQ